MIGKPAYDLHTLGWKSFQDLCVAIASEILQRPVQTFLPSKDAGRDGAFVGRWDDKSASQSSTIQCKFTSSPYTNLTLSLLAGEFEKLPRLVSQGLAEDYIILTNHPITGASELAIKKKFESNGVKLCRVFARDWIVAEIQKSPRLRMMVPRLYGLGDLSGIMDERAYEQAAMILSSLGDDLRKLVVTSSHRKSVKAITEHSIVLLLGAPATGKSVIGASLAVGAADSWKCMTIRASGPQYVLERLNPNEKQFFWIDDAWGSTQYQRNTIEDWNQAFPAIQAAIKRGSRFLFTSRDYIWAAAKQDLKSHALPQLGHSQVVINVQELTRQEKAQILYNHIKLGSQTPKFRSAIKPLLPPLAETQHFLPESARRLGSSFFTGNMSLNTWTVLAFFEKPEQFLVDTINGLASDVRAAIASVFMGGGRVNSPVGSAAEVALASEAYGVTQSAIRDALLSLEGSLLLLAQDQSGKFWTYKHPTVGDAFSKIVSRNPEFIEVYIRGAKPESIMGEVVCVGVEVEGAPVVVPSGLFPLLLGRLKSQASSALGRFISYRANREFAELLLIERADILDGLKVFFAPISEDSDTALLVRLAEFGLLSAEVRSQFVGRVHETAVRDADPSFIRDDRIRNLLTKAEYSSIATDVAENLLVDIPGFVQRVREEWDGDSPPSMHFDHREQSLKTIILECGGVSAAELLAQVSNEVKYAVEEMEEEFDEPNSDSEAVSSPSHSEHELAPMFSDVDR